MIQINRRAISNQQKELRRQQIQESALALYETTTYHAVSMAQVAEAAGVAKGTVYLYFGTKEALFLSLLEREFEKWFAALDNYLRALPATAGSVLIVQAIGETLALHPTLLRLIAILHTVLERNIDLATALQFKQMLRERVLATGALLEEKMPDLQPGEGTWFLMQLYVLVIGFQHMAEPTPVVQRTLAQPGLDLFQIDFMNSLLRTLETLLAGMQHPSRSR